MNPSDPTSEPVSVTPQPHTPESLPPSEDPREPFYDYSDLFLFIGMLAASLLIAALLVRLVTAPFHPTLTLQLLLSQIVLYFLAFGALGALFHMRYFRPFWRSLGWKKISIGDAVGSVIAGPSLVIGLAILGDKLHAPNVGPPFEPMLGSRTNLALIGLLAVILGPLAEELAFRGFLMPLLIRSLGVAAGIILTGFIFGTVHLYEYQWSWQYMLLISLVGCVFGWAKYKTGSTATAALMHSVFNLTQFVALLAKSQIQ